MNTTGTHSSLVFSGLLSPRLLLLLWQAFPLDRAGRFSGVDAAPRVVTPRGDLAAEEKTTIWDLREGQRLGGLHHDP